MTERTGNYKGALTRPAPKSAVHVPRGYESIEEADQRRKEWPLLTLEEMPTSGMGDLLVRRLNRNPHLIMAGDEQDDGSQCWHTHKAEILRRELVWWMGLYPGYMYPLAREWIDDMTAKKMKCFFWSRCRFGNTYCCNPAHMEVVFRGGQAIP